VDVPDACWAWTEYAKKECGKKKTYARDEEGNGRIGEHTCKRGA